MAAEEGLEPQDAPDGAVVDVPAAAGVEAAGGLVEAPDLPAVERTPDGDPIIAGGWIATAAGWRPLEDYVDNTPDATPADADGVPE